MSDSQVDVRVSGLVFGYDGTESARTVLKGVDLVAERGSVTAVVGPNGSGKSTLLKVISAYLCPGEGRVQVRGMDPHTLTPLSRSRLVTYCGDEPEPAFEFTVEETVMLGRVALGPGEGDREVAERAMKEAGVFDLRSRAIASLSSGERQRAYIARAICQDPEVFLLDEPTAHLDMSYELHVMELVTRLAKERGKTVLAVLHDLNLALRFASKIYFMKDGAIAHAVMPDGVTPQIIRAVYGVESSIMRHPALGCPVVITAGRAGTSL